MVKNGFAGKNIYVSIAPFGNRVAPTIESDDLVLTKHSGHPFTYEEVHGIIKKILSFKQIDEVNADNIIKLARINLESVLTLFFPTHEKPKVEICYAYNWASIEFKAKDFKEAFMEVRDAVKEYQKPSVKIFSNNLDIISLHNYDMKGICILRKTYEKIATILEEQGVTLAIDHHQFVVQATAFGIKSVMFMEGRAQAENADETYSIKHSRTYSPALGNMDFVTSIYAIMCAIARKGLFSDLKPEQLKILEALTDNPALLDKYELTDSIQMCLQAFLADFKLEIDAAFAKVSSVVA